MKLKNKLALSGAAAVAVFSFGIKANAATDNRPVLDLSEWQGTITAHQAEMLKSEVKGVILRVQYGSNYKDKVFDHNAAMLKVHGVKFGVYAYGQYVTSTDAKTEAKTFYARAKGYKPLFYVNDAESLTTYAGHSYAAATKVFAKQMKSLTSKPTYIYSYQGFYRAHINSQAGYMGMWLAAYQKQQPAAPFVYQLWQNADNHWSSALQKAVDSSKFIGTANWFGHTIDKSKFPVGGYKVGDKVKMKSGITYYGTKTKADKVLTKKALTVKAVKTSYTGKSNQVLTVYNGSRVIGQVRAQDVTKVKTATQKATKKATKKVVKKSTKASTQSYKQHGVFYPNTTLNVRTGAGTSYRVVATYFKGESVIYDKVIIKHDYVWARYRRAVGGYGYVALGVNGGQSYGLRYIY